MMQRSGIRPFLFGGVACVLVLAGQRALHTGASWEAALWLGAGVATFLAIFWSRAYDPLTALQIRLPEEVWRPVARDSWGVRVGGGLLVIALLAALNGVQIFHEFEPMTTQAWWWHLASVLIALAGVALLDYGLDFGRAVRAATSHAAHDADVTGQWRARLRALRPGAAWLLAILSVAVFFRLFRFNELPFGVWYDEAESGLQALNILGSDTFRPIFDGATMGAAHYLYLTAASFELFGVSVQSIRLVSVIFGIGAVLAAFLVGKELFGWRIGLVTAALFAVSSWAVTLSRFGMYATMTTPLFTLLTFYFLLRGLRTRQLSDYALAGLWIGLGLCFYTSFRLFVPVVALFLAYQVIYTGWTQRTWPPAAFWLGAGLMIFVALLVVTPLGVYAYKHPEIFWDRIETTFLFTGKSEAERWPALWENVRRHLFMFNVAGDPNGRHNLPGNPMLDPVSGSLFLLGVAYALRRLLQPRYLALLLWLAVSLAAGIFSLDFEAPQSLRANGTLPVAYLLATLPLAVLARAWWLAAARTFPHALRWPAVALVAVVAVLNFNTYFVRQATDFAAWNAYSTPETLAARLLAELDPNTDAYVTSFFHGHPTIKFVAREARPFVELDTLDQFPLDFAPGRAALLILNADSRGLYDEARRLYPNGVFTETTPPFGGPPVLFTARLAPEEIASLRGVTARYFANDAWSGEPAIVRSEPQLAADWTQGGPLPAPFTAEWEGILHAASAGAYDFQLEAPAAAELHIGERTILTGTGVISGVAALAEGNHTLRLRATGAPGRMILAWRPPDRALEAIPPTVLYNAPRLGNGLLGRYFGNGDWTAPEIFSRIDARFDRYVHVTPLPRPYTVEWTGKLAAPVAGVYRFGLESIDESALWIDEALVVRADQPNTLREGEITLTQGLHDIRIRFGDRTNHTHLNVFWQPPGHDRAILPREVLYPPQASYARVTLPTLEMLQPAGSAAPESPAAPAAEPALAGVARVVVSGLAAPRGVAVAEDGALYVSESGAQRVVHVSADGEQLRVLDGGEEPFVELTDLAVVGDRLFVLDAGAGRVRAFALDGAPLPYADAIDPAFADRARGIGAGMDGGVLIANTPNNRIVALDSTGAVVGETVVWPGEDAQPVDAVLGQDGRLFVTDGQGHRLIRYAPGGQVERAWPLAVANTVDSPHLAVGAGDLLYVTDPEQGRILVRDAQGEAIGAWNLNVMLGQPVRPIGIAVDSAGVIWIVDSGGLLIALEPHAEG